MTHADPAPDTSSTDAERIREAIEAWQAQQTDAPPPPMPVRRPVPPAIELEITIAEAFAGVRRPWKPRGEDSVSLALPAGLRDAEQVEIPGAERTLTARIRIAPEPDRAVIGDDLWLTLAVDPHLLEDGGRVEVETPSGRRNVWVPRALPQDARLRIKGCGLPARDDAPAGHVYVKLVPDPSLAGSAARALLDRFAATWTAEQAGLRRAVG
jgi:curved DNA-binding protein